MSVEETKKFYEELLTIIPENDYKRAARVSIKAIDKQIPKEHHHTKVVNINGTARKSLCPACLGVIITAESEYPRYCDWCGQAIDWSDLKPQENKETRKKLYEKTLTRLIRIGAKTSTEQIISLAEEIEQYRDKIHRIESAIVKQGDTLHKLVKENQEYSAKLRSVKLEAIREYAEKLKDCINDDKDYDRVAYDLFTDIDHIVLVMTEDSGNET